jgi:hypothetical protein
MSQVEIDLPLSRDQFEQAINKDENAETLQKSRFLLFGRSRAFINMTNFVFIMAIAILAIDLFVVGTVLILNAVEDSYPALFFISLGQPVVAVAVLAYATLNVFYDNNLNTTATVILAIVTLLALAELTAEVVNLALRIYAAGSLWADIFDGNANSGYAAFTEVLYVVFSVILTIASLVQASQLAVLLSLTNRFVEQKKIVEKLYTNNATSIVVYGTLPSSPQIPTSTSKQLMRGTKKRN